ncbi:uncharacterized protein DUF4169 [Roseiarcus fermentans]|uniref:Uncharacterized protein DUF4169 n=1 Tax=Roseiarcus fermentans TaxID=1473586 RepID=A0A366FUN1_9HYPH|nr:DUF4169 family protein [Roseiarcus fermentans]RBP18383.1 uncharacterized protein DUF4169 [Roseiarcus fermentans]
MGDIVNLRRARKRRDRERESAAAAENRVVFGTPKAERRRIEAEREAGDRRLDGHKLEPDGRD